MDVPAVDVTHLESPTPLNPLGVKGAGEGGTIPAAAAIVAAVESALAPFGIEIADAPITPEKIVALLGAAGACGAPARGGCSRRPRARALDFIGGWRHPPRCHDFSVLTICLTDDGEICREPTPRVGPRGTSTRPPVLPGTRAGAEARADRVRGCVRLRRALV